MTLVIERGLATNTTKEMIKNGFMACYVDRLFRNALFDTFSLVVTTRTLRAPSSSV